MIWIILIAVYLIPAVVCWMIIRKGLKDDVIEDHIALIIFTLCPFLNVAAVITLMGHVIKLRKISAKKFFGL